jgi:lipoprotein-releasing system permease protein
MNLPFELHIALRYLFAKRKQAFISVISLISTLGVIVGVMALVIALALMTGLQHELRDRILGSTAHIYVWKQGGITDYQAEAARLRRIPRVTGAAPAILGKALVTSSHGEAFITIKGVDPSLENSVSDIARSIQTGSLEALQQSSDDQPPGILLGRDLASQLSSFVGDSVSVFTQQGTLSPMGLLPRARRFRVIGIFNLGLYEFDSGYGFVSLPLAERLFDKDRVDLIQLRVDNIYAAPQIARSIVADLGTEYLAQDWTEMNRSLFSALWLEKMAISITIGLIVMVAALNIIASLILLVMEKSRDIAILKTMGSPAASIRRIFMLQGLIIGLIGTSAGAIAGCTLIYILDRYRLIHVPIDVYQISYVPFTLMPLDFLIVIAAAVLICFVATIYPSRQASKLDPAQALRYQ